MRIPLASILTVTSHLFQVSKDQHWWVATESRSLSYSQWYMKTLYLPYGKQKGNEAMPKTVTPHSFKPISLSVLMWHGWGPLSHCGLGLLTAFHLGYLKLHFTQARCPLPKWSLLPSTFIVMSIILTPKKSCFLILMFHINFVYKDNSFVLFMCHCPPRTYFPHTIMHESHFFHLMAKAWLYIRPSPWTQFSTP